MLNEVFSDYFAQRKNYLTAVDTRAKMLLVAAAIIIVVSSRHSYVPLIAFFASLVFLLGIRIPPKVILLRFAAPLSIASAILVMQIFFYGMAEGLSRGFLIMAKVIGATSLVIFLSMTTPVNKLLKAARWFKVPNTWVEVAMISYRYIFVLLEDAMTIRDAQKMRLGYSGLARSLRSFGELMGSAVIRAYDRSIAVYESMMLRGYNGTTRNIVWEEKFMAKDAVAIIIFIVILASLLALGFCSISSLEANTGRLVIILSIPFFSCSRKNHLTILSSSEW